MNSWLRRFFDRPVAMEVSSLRRENVDSNNPNGALGECKIEFYGMSAIRGTMLKSPH